MFPANLDWWAVSSLASRKSTRQTANASPNSESEKTKKNESWVLSQKWSAPCNDYVFLWNTSDGLNWTYLVTYGRIISKYKGEFVDMYVTEGYPATLALLTCGFQTGGRR